MRQFLRVALVAMVLVGVSRSAAAEPLLQLDVVGGRYDLSTESILSNGPVFQLVALLTPKAGASFNAGDWYYVSAAITPQMAPPGGNYGSFTWSDAATSTRTIQATGGMEYGTPPIESSLVGLEPRDPGDLATHGIYPTYFTEFAFQFLPGDRSTTYNSATATGGLTPNALGGTYYHVFNLNVSGLTAPISALHFDLYDTFLKTECMGPTKSRVCSVDEDVDHFAPFSHDAQSGPGVPVVPEPATLVLLATGLAVSARSIRRRPGTK